MQTFLYIKFKDLLQKDDKLKILVRNSIFKFFFLLEKQFNTKINKFQC